MKCIKLKLEEEQTLSNDTVLNSLQPEQKWELHDGMQHL
jgi:hypothetical protein